MTDLDQHLRARAELWADLDHVDRLAGQIGRRTAELGIQPSVAHCRLTAGEAVDELVAIDAAVVSETLSVAENRARIEEGEGVLEGRGERYRLAARALAASVILVVALIMVSVVV